jgi:hypothetical protein
MRLAVLASCLLCTTTTLFAQDDELGKLGINLRVESGPSIGIDWRVSPKMTLRPVLTFQWSKTETPFGTDERTQYGVGLDVLFRAASWDRVTSYYGIGAAFANISGAGTLAGNAWATKLLIGARVKVIERVALFGEIGVQYVDAEGFFGKQFSLETFPLGVTVFLK